MPVCVGHWLLSWAAHDVTHFLHLGPSPSSNTCELQRLSSLDADPGKGAPIRYTHLLEPGASHTEKRGLRAARQPQQDVRRSDLLVPFGLHSPKLGFPAHLGVVGPCDLF